MAQNHFIYWGDFFPNLEWGSMNIYAQRQSESPVSHDREHLLGCEPIQKPSNFNLQTLSDYCDFGIIQSSDPRLNLSHGAARHIPPIGLAARRKQFLSKTSTRPQFADTVTRDVKFAHDDCSESENYVTREWRRNCSEIGLVF